MIRPSAVIAFLIALFLSHAVPLVAQEAPKEDSAAAKLFRDAWWAETGSGALDQALESYTKAAAAEGSEAIRARAVYRSALVLQRMGRSPKAVKALQRLAKQFPAQTALLAKAKRQLDEWDAEDLRGKFGDWYRRYQYGAEFQAKIVDLILKLGGSDNKASQAAQQALLTIGAPALEALKEHASSPNARLRSSVIALIIDIGALPAPDALWTTSQWRKRTGFWKLLHASEGSERAAYAQAAAARTDDFRARWIEAALAGPAAVVAIVAKERGDAQSVVEPYLTTMLDTGPSPEIYAAARAIVSNEAANAYVRMGVAKRLLHRWRRALRDGKDDPTGLSVAEILTWVDGDSRIVREVVYEHMRSGSVPSPDAWLHVAKRVRSLPPRDGEQYKAIGAMNGQLRLAAEGADLTPAIEALSHYLSEMPASGIDPSPMSTGTTLAGDAAIPMRVLVQAVIRTRGDVVRGAPYQLWSRYSQIEGAFQSMLEIAGSAVDREVGGEAVSIIAREIRADVGRLTALLGDPSLREKLNDKLFHGLRRNPALLRLDWSAEGFARLAEAATLHPKFSATRRSNGNIRVDGRTIRYKTNLTSSAGQVFAQFLAEPALRDRLFEAALLAPERFPANFWSHVGEDWGQEDANRALAVRKIGDRWKSWKGERRTAGVRLFVSEDVLGRGTDEGATLVRQVLAAGGLGSETRLSLMHQLLDLTLEDLKSVYDFDKVEEVEQSVELLLRLPTTEEVYDAFKGVLQRDGKYAITVGRHFQQGPASRFPDLIRRMFAHGYTGMHKDALLFLRTRKSVQDLPLWIEALGHKTSHVRAEAAKMLGTLYNDAAIKALAGAVDDSDPTVRDAVLASLERIEKIEQQKRRWREFARDKRAPKK